MNNRWPVWIPGLAALVCASIIIYLIIQIDQTRRQLQDDGVMEFNFIQQTDHNLDAFGQALIDYMEVSAGTVVASRKEYLQRYDILYSSIRHVSTTRLGNLAHLQSTVELLRDVNDFLDRLEPMMRMEQSISRQELHQIKREASSLSARVYEIGLEMFERKSVIRDHIARRMDDLYQALAIFSIFFVIASMMTIVLLLGITRRTAQLRAESLQTQTRLTSALDELTTGDIERRAQNRFMAAASHDLRQPLHALGLYLNALRRYVNGDQGMLILANIHRSTEALNQLLNSMLDLSKLDAGVVDVNRENINLDEVFDHLHQNFLPEANQRQLALDIQYSGLHVYSDQVLLERILGNLVANALNCTSQGRVSLRAASVGDKVRLSVTDTGPGIPLSEQEAIFNEYYQLQNPERDRNKGLGLGLSIVRRLTRLLEIELNISSIEGKGTTFEILLPPADGVGSDGSTSRADRMQTYSRDDLSGLSILVIDDEQDVRDGMCTLLEQYSCDVFAADSSEQACEYIIATGWVPDVIIADYRLRAEKTGDMAIEQVREEVNLDIPAMIITGDTSPARLREATASGFPLLHKPVIADELLDAITRLVGDSK